MIWWHRVGQRVACKVQARAWGTLWSNDEHPAPKKGVAITIKRVLVEAERVGFQFEEIQSGDFHYDAVYFDPVRDTSIESLRELLNPTPEQRRALYQEDIEKRQRELAEAPNG